MPVDKQKLEGCPFCGAQPTPVRSEKNFATLDEALLADPDYRCQTTSCPLRYTTTALTRAEWNTRTTPSSAPVAEGVTDEDRHAASRHLRRTPLPKKLIEAIEDGLGDDHPLVQDFARHRIAALQSRSVVLERAMEDADVYAAVASIKYTALFDAIGAAVKAAWPKEGSTPADNAISISVEDFLTSLRNRMAAAKALRDDCLSGANRSEGDGR